MANALSDTTVSRTIPVDAALDETVRLSITSNEPSLDNLLDKIVDGTTGDQTFHLELSNAARGLLMQVFEIVQIERGKTVLVRSRDNPPQSSPVLRSNAAAARTGKRSTRDRRESL